MLLAPYLAGLLVAWSADWSSARVIQGIAGLTGIVMLHMGRPSLVRLLKRRVVAGPARDDLLPLAAGAALFLLPGAAIFLFLGSMGGYPGLWWLAAAALLFGGLHTIYSLRRRERSELAELIGVMLLTMTAPLGFYLGSGSFARQSWTIWALSALYFGASIFVIRARLRGAGVKSPVCLQPVISAWAYLAFMVSAVIFLVFTGLVPYAASMAFLPALLWSGNSLAHTGSRLQVKREGVVQSVLALWFLAMLTGAYIF